MECSFGCGRLAIHQQKNGKNICGKSNNSCPVLIYNRRKGRIKSNSMKGVDYKQLYLSLDESTKQRMASNKGKTIVASSLMFSKESYYTNHSLTKRILKDKIFPYICQICNMDSWRDKKITLDLDHINGDIRDNRISNLRFLCPNCHSQTPTFKTKGNGIKKVSDETLINAIKNTYNIRKALIEVGLSPKGSNYQRVYELKNKYSLKHKER